MILRLSLGKTSGWARDVMWAETAPYLAVVAHGPEDAEGA